MPTRRIFELMIITVALWDISKGSIRLWERRVWRNSPPGSLMHDAADLTSIFVG